MLTKCLRLHARVSGKVVYKYRVGYARAVIESKNNNNKTKKKRIHRKEHCIANVNTKIAIRKKKNSKVYLAVYFAK